MSGEGLKDIYEKAGIETFSPKDGPGGLSAAEQQAAAEKGTKTEETTAATETTETTAAETTTETTTQSTETVDYAAKFLEELNAKAGTQYGGIDDVLNLINSEKTLRGSVSEMQSKMQNYKNPLEGNELLGKIYQFTNETGLGLDAFNMLNGVDFDQMDPIDVITMSRLIDNPELASERDVLRTAVARGLKLDEEDIDEAEMSIRKMNAKLQSGDAKKKLLELQSKISVPDFSKSQDTEALAAARAKNLKDWEPLLPDVVSQLDKINIFDSPEDQKAGKDPLYSHAISDDVRSDYAAKFNQYISQTGVQPTEEVKAQLFKMAQDDYILSNFQNIARAYADSVKEKIENEWLAKTGKDTRDLGKTETKTGVLNDVQQFNKDEQDKVLKGMGIKRK